MVKFSLAGITLVGPVVEVRGSNSVVKVSGVRYTVPTVDLTPFPNKGK